MNKHVSRVRIVGAASLLLATAFATGCARRSGTHDEEPQGRFTMEVDPAWQPVETDGSCAQSSVAAVAFVWFLN